MISNSNYFEFGCCPQKHVVKLKIGGKQINWNINLFKWLYLLLWSVCVLCQAILSTVDVANWEVCRKSNTFIQSEKSEVPGAESYSISNELEYINKRYEQLRQAIK